MAPAMVAEPEGLATSGVEGGPRPYTQHLCCHKLLVLLEQHLCRRAFRHWHRVWPSAPVAQRARRTMYEWYYAPGVHRSFLKWKSHWILFDALHAMVARIHCEYRGFERVQRAWRSWKRMVRWSRKLEIIKIKIVIF